MLIRFIKILFMLAPVFFTACAEKDHSKNVLTNGASSHHCLVIKSGWVREVIPGQNVTAGYPVLQNVCDADITIKKITSANASTVEIHQHQHHNSRIRMIKKSELLLKAKDVLTFSPGNLHLMIFDPAFHQDELYFDVQYQYDKQMKKLAVVLPIKKLNEQMNYNDEK